MDKDLSEPSNVTSPPFCTIESIDAKLDPSSGRIAEKGPDCIESDDTAIVSVRPKERVVRENLIGFSRHY